MRIKYVSQARIKISTDIQPAITIIKQHNRKLDYYIHQTTLSMTRSTSDTDPFVTQKWLFLVIRVSGVFKSTPRLVSCRCCL